MKYGGRLIDLCTIYGVKSLVYVWEGSQDGFNVSDLSELVVGTPWKLLAGPVIDRMEYTLRQEIYDMSELDGLHNDEGGEAEIRVDGKKVTGTRLEHRMSTESVDVSGFELPNKYKNKEQKERHKRFKNLCLTLARDGIATANITWAGSGDSGGIEEIEFVSELNESIDRPASFYQIVRFFDDFDDCLPVSGDDRGGQCYVTIDVEKQTLSAVAEDNEVESEEFEINLALGTSAPDPLRCETCFTRSCRGWGKRDYCQREGVERFKRMQHYGFFGLDILNGVREIVPDKLIPHDDLRDAFYALYEGEEYAQRVSDKMVEIYDHLARGVPGFAISQLSHQNDSVPAALLRLYLNQYPYMEWEK